MRVSVGHTTVRFQSNAANLPLPGCPVKPWPQNVKLARCWNERRTLLNPHKHIALTVGGNAKNDSVQLETKKLMKEKLTIETHRTLHTFANRTSLPTIQNLQKSTILANPQLTNYKND
jgi:hypothetical protein